MNVIKAYINSLYVTRVLLPSTIRFYGKIDICENSRFSLSGSHLLTYSKIFQGDIFHKFCGLVAICENLAICAICVSIYENFPLKIKSCSNIKSSDAPIPILVSVSALFFWRYWICISKVVNAQYQPII